MQPRNASNAPSTSGRRHIGTSRRSRREGFTVAELLVVLAIMALVSAMAAPRLFAVLGRWRVRSASAVLTADIRWAQELAQREAQRTRLRFDQGTGSYRVEVANAATRVDPCASTDFREVKRVTLGTEFDLTLSTNPSTGCIFFEPTGRPGEDFPIEVKLQSRASGINPVVITVAPTTGRVSGG